jgi:hypothetical protein
MQGTNINLRGQDMLYRVAEPLDCAGLAVHFHSDPVQITLAARGKRMR